MQTAIEVIVILILFIINGVFAMAEIAIVSSRKSKLQKMADGGNKTAEVALKLVSGPNRFLPTVQIGITLVGIFAGAFGGATIAEHLARYIDTIPILKPYSEALALLPVVAVITYISLIIGELVPKRIALSNPEKVALLVARPMAWLSKSFAPLVSLLSISTDWILGLLHIKDEGTVTVSEEEIRTLIREGAKIGILQLVEQDIVERTFKLSDKKVNALMTPRKEIVWINIEDSFRTIRKKIAQTKNIHSYYPVCRDSVDKVLGVVRTEDLLANYLIEEKIDLKKVLHKPLFIPETMNALHVLGQFKKTGLHMAMVVDEYGTVQGLIWMNDILEALVGDIPKINKLEEQEIMKREDGSFLVDGLVTIDEFKEYFHIGKIEGEKSGNFHTIGGFVMHRLGRIPVSGDKVELDIYTIEVVDMDVNRIDKILITTTKIA